MDKKSLSGKVGSPEVRWYYRYREAEISTTISDDVLAAIEKLAGPSVSRSELVQRVLRSYAERCVRTEKDAGELERINRGAERLNGEAGDVLEYQIRVGEQQQRILGYG